MSVIIKGMSMPETCYECRFWEYYSEYSFKPFCVAHLNLIEDPRSGRLDTCPLVGVSEIEEDAYGRGYDSAVETMTRLLMERKPHYFKDGAKNENWYTELDEPKFDERSEDEQT